jgi:hypothetical protein
VLSLKEKRGLKRKKQAIAHGHRKVCPYNPLRASHYWVSSADLTVADARNTTAAADLNVPDDLISFLKAIPSGRYSRGVRYPQWLLLLVGMLGVLSACRSSRDLEAFAKRREALDQSLGLNLKRWPSDATFVFLFNKTHLQEFGEVLKAWMISQVQGEAERLDQMVCDGKTMRSSAIETEDGNHRFVAQVNVYGRVQCVALAQRTYETHESREKATFKELLSGLDIEGVLIQADALHTKQAFFAGAWDREPTSF